MRFALNVDFFALQVLSHLDHLRQCCQMTDLRVYSLEPIQRALQVAQLNGDDTQKQAFSDLFALAEAEERNQKTGRGGHKVGKSRSSKPKASLKEISDSSENSSDVSSLFTPIIHFRDPELPFHFFCFTQKEQKVFDISGVLYFLSIFYMNRPYLEMSNKFYTRKFRILENFHLNDYLK